MGRLERRVAVITGGANGIGRACAELFAREGAAVLVADVADEAGMATVGELEREGYACGYRHCNVTRSDEISELMAAAVRDLGGLDVLVASAGIAHADAWGGIDTEVDRVVREPASGADRFLDSQLTEWQAVLDVNLTGTFLALKAAAQTMTERQTGGAIVTVSSIAAKHPGVGRLAYGVSKAGVWMLTKHAATALAANRIRVNALGPGFIDTNMTAALRRLPEIEAQVLDMIPLGRVGTAAEAARAALFLTSDESAYITGTMLHCDGGVYTD